MNWDYRLIKHDIKQPTYVAVHEVYYDDDGKIQAWTLNPIELSGQNRSQILRDIDMIKLDIKAPILSEAQLEETVKSKIKLVMTCLACPEQYEAFLDNKQVGYLRLRHGKFRVDFPNHGGEVIYQAQPNGDGSFDEAERDFYLKEAIKAIEARLAKTS